MIIELSLIAGVNYITYRYAVRDFLKFKKEFDEIANELKAIGKYLNIQNKNSKQVNEILKEKYK